MIQFGYLILRSAVMDGTPIYFHAKKSKPNFNVYYVRVIINPRFTG